MKWMQPPALILVCIENKCRCFSMHGVLLLARSKSDSLWPQGTQGRFSSLSWIHSRLEGALSLACQVLTDFLHGLSFSSVYSAPNLTAPHYGIL